MECTYYVICLLRAVYILVINLATITIHLSMQAASQQETQTIPTTIEPYHALLIPDIQDHILSHLPSKDQAQMARLSKAFTDSALNSVYRKLTSLVGIFAILGPIKISTEQLDNHLQKYDYTKYRYVISPECFLCEAIINTSLLFHLQAFTNTPTHKIWQRFHSYA